MHSIVYHRHETGNYIVKHHDLQQEICVGPGTAIRLLGLQGIRTVAGTTEIDLQTTIGLGFIPTAAMLKRGANAV